MDGGLCIRFYNTVRIVNDGVARYFACVKDAHGTSIEIEVSSEVWKALDDLQREFWRIEKREQRHCVHLDTIPEAFLPLQSFSKSPEDYLIDHHRRNELTQAMNVIPEKQARRMILRYIFDLPIKRIALIEGCSERAIKYSIKLAKRNLKKLLDADL